MSDNDFQPVRIVFFGTPEFAVTPLLRLHEDPAYSLLAVVTQPDRPAGRGNKPQRSPIKEAAESEGLPVFQPDNLRRDLNGFLEQWNTLGPIDVGVVVAYGQILPADLISRPARGMVNIHASLLPRWRGAAPIQRAILSGDSETGVCIMQLEEALDTGPVYARSVIPITDSDSFETLHNRLAEEGATLLCSSLTDIVAGKLTAETQALEGVTYASKIINRESLIDWSQPAKDIARQVRALSPAPGAFTVLAGKRLKIFVATPLDRANSGHAAAGDIVGASPLSLDVQCGSGILQLLEVQIEGKRRMKIDDFIRGVTVEPGSSLGKASSTTIL